jgi:catechol 2,3-dioxygenase-like lactoylglutathione lyase family enzyme
MAQPSTEDEARVRARVDHVMVGASDLDATVAFFGSLGFGEVSRSELDDAVAGDLYGLPAPAREVVLGVPGVDSGRLRIVEAPSTGPHERDGFRRGAHAIDLYTTDMAASVAVAREAGAHVGPVADYPFGPVHLTQAMAIGPDGVEVVFVGIDHRLPSVLDDRPDLLHSQVHSMVWSVDDIDVVTSFFTDVVGLDLRSSFPIDVPAVSEFMMLERHAPIRMTVMASSDVSPPRFELLEYTDAKGGVAPSLPLGAGSVVPVFVVDDLGAMRASLEAAGADVAKTVEVGQAHAFCATSPGGVDFEVRSISGIGSSR